MSDLFVEGTDDADLLARKLRDPNPRLPLEIQQKGKDGTLRSVEVAAQVLDLGSRRLLSITAHDVTVRRTVHRLDLVPANAKSVPKSTGW